MVNYSHQFSSLSITAFFSPGRLVFLTLTVATGHIRVPGSLATLPWSFQHRGSHSLPSVSLAVAWPGFRHLNPVSQEGGAADLVMGAPTAAALEQPGAGWKALWACTALWGLSCALLQETEAGQRWDCSCLSCFRFQLLLPALRFWVPFSLVVTGISMKRGLHS